MPDPLLDSLHSQILLCRIEKMSQMDLDELYSLKLQCELQLPQLEPGSQDKLLAIFTQARAEEALEERRK